MARLLKQSTSVDVPIGPFLDASDGVTAETALTITQPDIRLKKNGGAWAQKAAAQTLSHEENGYYEVTLDATDTNTLGLLRLAVAESGALPIWEDFIVLPANVYDSLVAGSDTLNANVTEWNSASVAVPETAGVPVVDVGYAAGVAWGTGAISAASIASNAITSAKIATGAITTATFAAGAINAAAIAADAITDAKVASDVTIASVTGAVGSVTGNVGGNVAGSVGSVTGAVGSVTGAVGSVTGNVGGNVTGSVGSVVGNVGGNVTGSVGSVTTVSDKTGYSLSTAGVDAVLDDVVEGSLTLRHFIRLMGAALLGELSGAATTTIVVRDASDTKTRITATVDADGNRSAMSLDAT
jgi:hypothetical protein